MGLVPYVSKARTLSLPYIMPLYLLTILASPHPGFVLRQNRPSPWQGEGIKGWGKTNVG